MIATVTLNSAIDKVFILPTRAMEKLNRVEKGIAIPGGGGINSAYTFHAFKDEVVVMGFIGGEAGRFTEDEIRKTQISTNFTYIEGQTRTDYIILNKYGKVLTQINEKGPWIKSKETESFIESFKRVLSRCEMVLLSGSLPQGVGTDFYARLITMAHEKNVRTVLKASREALSYGIEAGPYMVLPNIKGVDSLMGIKIIDVRKRVEAARKILEKGVQIVAMNGDGYYLVVTPEKIWEIGLPKTEIINSIGMGDAFIGGMMYILKDKEDLPEAMRYGGAASISSALQVEAKVKSREQMEQFFDKIEVKELSLS